MIGGPKFFFIEDLTEFSEVGALLELSSPLSHQVSRVLRASVGDSVRLVDDKNQVAAIAKIVSLGKNVCARILEPLPFVSTHFGLDVLVVGLLKGKRNELITEKATELGVRQIVVFQGDHSVAKAAEKPQKLLSALRSCARAACQQCGRMDPPQVCFGSTLSHGLGQVKNDSVLSKGVCLLDEHALAVRTFLDSSNAHLFVVGPEGDFSKRERDVLREQQFQPVSLGSLRLRSETAALAVASLGLLATLQTC